MTIIRLFFSKLSMIIHDFYSRIRAFHKARVLRKMADLEPVFVLGVQKSGTTAIAALLAKATNQSVTLDITRAIKRPEWKVLLRYGIGSFEDYVYRYRSAFRKKIVKEPGLTFYFEELRRVFPKARFVIILREPKDNIRSILNRLDVPGDAADVDLQNYPKLWLSPAWRINFDTSWLGYCHENYIDALAYRWKRSAEIYFNAEDDFLMIRYEDFIADKQASVELLSQKLGLKVKQDISGIVDRQYQSRGERVKDYGDYYKKNERFIDRQTRHYSERLGY